MRYLLLFVSSLLITTVAMAQDYSAAYKAVDQLAQEGKYRSALDRATELYQTADSAGDQDDMLKALAYRASFTFQLEEDGFQEALRLLEAELSENAKRPVVAPVLNYLIGKGYYTYAQQNAYRLSEVTAVATQEGRPAAGTPLEDWTLRQLANTADEHLLRALELALEQRTQLSSFPAILDRPAAPARGLTLYDLLAREIGDLLNEPLLGVGSTTPASAPGYLVPANQFTQLPLDELEEDSGPARRLRLFQQQLAYHLETGGEGLMLTDLERVEYVRGLGVADSTYLATLQRMGETYAGVPGNDVFKLRRAQVLAAQTATDGKRPKAEALALLREISDTSAAIYNKRHRLEVSIQARELNVTAEEVYLPSRNLLFKVDFRNVSNLYLRLVRIPQQDLPGGRVQRLRREKLSDYANYPAVAEKSFRLPNTGGDYERHNTEAWLPNQSPGAYLLLASTDANFSEETETVAVGLQVSNLALLEFDNGDGSVSEVQNRLTGAPLAGVRVEVHLETNRRSGTYRLAQTLTTDARGRFQKPTYDRQRAVFILRSGQDQLISNDQYLYRRERYEEGRAANFTPLLTDRSLYRPGQTVHLYGVTLRRDRSRMPGLLPGTKRVVTLHDANYQEIASQTATSDEYGRFNLTFTLPTTGLTGTFRLETDGGSTAFSVEEYKRPRFEVELNGPEYVVGGEEAVFTGKANLYAGPAVNDATVNYRVFVEEQYYFWYYRRPADGDNRELVYFGEAATDASGEFTVAFTPDADLARQRKRFRYVIEADVADATGETRTASTDAQLRSAKPVVALNVGDNYTVGDSLKIEASGSDETITISYRISKVTQPSAALENRKWDFPELPLLNAEEYEDLFPNLPAVAAQPLAEWPVEQALVTGRELTITEGKGSDSLILSDYPAGHYRLDWAYPDGTAGDPISFTVANPAAERLPAGELFSVDRLSGAAQPGEPIRFRLVSAIPLPHVTYSFLSRRGAALESTAAENSTVITYLPTDDDRGGIRLDVAFVYAGDLYTRQYEIKLGWENKELTIDYATFRDKLRPGAPETWTLTIRGADGEPVDAAAVASMYDASLDQIRPAMPWAVDPYPGINRWRNFAQLEMAGVQSGRVAVRTDGVETKRETPLPQLDLSPLVWGGNGGRVFGRSAPARSKEMTQGAVMFEAMSIDEETVEADNTAPAPAPTVEGRNGQADAPDAPVTIRKNLQETAFWLPKLTTNAAGELVVSFTSPEALTRWKFRVFTHDKELNFGTSEREVVTQKELMVLPNVPRFLREGDRVELTARVNNLTEAGMTVRVEVEFFNPITGEPVEMGAAAGAMNCTEEQRIGANSGETFCFPLFIQDGFSSQGPLGYRVIARGEGFSDGEENVFPVLTDRTLVTASQAFHLKKSGQKTIELPVLAGANSSTLRHVGYTFEATTNPAWIALKALPYLMEYPYECTEQLANRYFANQLAYATVQSKPVLETVFRKWQADSNALKSELEQNESLKNALLTETPWVRAAQSETEQRARLATLFDLKRLAGAQTAALDKLAQRQTGNGWFSWFPGGGENRYMTQYVVETLSRMRQLGVIPPEAIDKVDRITQSAINYLDGELVDDYRRLKESYKKAEKGLDDYQPGSSQIHYLYARALSGVERPNAGAIREALDFYTRRAAATWTKTGLYKQALLASAALQEGGGASKLYGGVGELILESLRERAIRKDEFGMYWKYGRGFQWTNLPIETHCRILEAFQLGHGTTEELDEMRLWLLTNKRTSRWPTTKSTAAAVYALLNTGTDWVASGGKPIRVTWPDADPEFNLPGRIIEAQTSAEAATGAFSINLPGEQISPALARVTVKNRENRLVWGGVYWQYTELAGKVAASNNGPLTLDRELFHRKPTDDGERLVPITADTPLAPGDRITVRLIVRTDRDLDYVHLKDRRAATFEPVDQLSGYQYKNGLGYYYAPGDLATNLFIDRLPKGTYTIEYDLFTTYTGTFSNGLGRAQCMYAPEFGANTAGATISVE